MNTSTKVGAATVAAGIVYYGAPRLPIQTQIILVGILVLAGIVLMSRRGRTAARVVRFGERSRRKHGVASGWDVLRHGSAWSVRRRARQVRPSLGHLSPLGRWRVPTSAAGVKLVRAGLLNVWVSSEDVVTIFGAPRSGKTGLLASRIVDAPGAVIATSTRFDLLRLVERLRRRGGRPVYVYNPAGWGGVKSTLAFDPLAGCADPLRATETAHDMLPGGDDSGERAYWVAQGRRVLAVLLHAAALEGLPITVVADWLADPEGTANEVYSALRSSPDPAHLQIARQFVSTPDRTRASITTTIMPALAWLTAPTAVEAVSEGVQLDVARLLTTRATVYLVGRHEAHTASLLAALTGRVVREARRLAAHQPNGRLEPPLTLALDEAARIAPIDLPDLSGDCGGSGVTLLAVFQSMTDMAACWGERGADRLLNNSAARVLFGGCASARELDAWSKLAGERDEKAASHNAAGKKTGHSTRKVPVLPATLLSHPGRWRAIVFHRDMPPVIGRARMAWWRHDVRDTLVWRVWLRPVGGWRAGVLARLPGVRVPASPALAPGRQVHARPVGERPAEAGAGG